MLTKCSRLYIYLTMKVLITIQYVCHRCHSYLAKISSLRNIKASSPSIFNGNPPYSGNRTLSPTDTVIGIFTPSLVVKPGPTARTSPSFAFEMFASGNIMPPGVYSKNQSINQSLN